MFKGAERIGASKFQFYLWGLYGGLFYGGNTEIFQADLC